MICVVVPGQPRGKARPRFGNGHAFSDPVTQSYERELKAAAKEAMAGRAPMEGPLKIHIVADFYPPKTGSKATVRGRLEGWIRPTTKPDFDNIAKVIDGLNKIVWVDDAQIVHAVIEKRYSLEPQLSIIVEEWSLL